MKLIPLTIDKLFLDLAGNHWVLVMTGDGRRIVMSVGFLEGTAIEVVLNNTKPPRPLTPDTALAVIRRAGADLVRATVRDFRKGTFYATLEIRDAHGVTHELDSRPSDAIALALRAKAPIMATETVMAKSAKMEEIEQLAAKAMGKTGEKIGEA